MNKTKYRLSLSLVLIIFLGLSSALAVYSECAQAAHQLDFGGEHEAPSVHCLDVLAIGNVHASTTTRFHSKLLSTALPAVHEKLDRKASLGWIKDHPFWVLFSHRDLFRLEEVYRL